MPQLSIIIPTFNAGACIGRCLNSIGGQTFGSYEIIVQDGGSSDGTIETIKEFKRTFGQVDLQLFIEKDTGIYDAMNRGVGRARGEWLYFLGSDDEFRDRNVLEAIFQRSDLAACDVVYGDVRFVGRSKWAEGSPIYDGVFDFEKLLKKNICHQAIFYRTKFFKRVGKFNTDYVLYADWDFNMRCWTKTEFRRIELVVADFCADGRSGTGSDDRFRKEIASNVLKYFNISLWHPSVNTCAFAGFAEIAKMKESKLSLRRAASRIRRAIKPRVYG